MGAARAALSLGGADRERAALACLIEAVAELNANRLDAVRGPGHDRVLRAPIYDGPQP